MDTPDVLSLFAQLAQFFGCVLAQDLVHFEAASCISPEQRFIYK
jgi:hypothetical protein